MVSLNMGKPKRVPSPGNNIPWIIWKTIKGIRTDRKDDSECGKMGNYEGQKM